MRYLSAVGNYRLSRRSLLAALPALRLAAQTETTFSAGVKVVNVLTTVRNSQGQLVNDLTPEDFALTEDGRPQKIGYFSRETDIPLTLGLLVDTSLSVHRVLDDERDASHVFLNEVLRPDQDQAFVFHFDRDVELLQDLTNSRDKLRRAVDHLEVALPVGLIPRRYANLRSRGRPGGTLLFDAIHAASNGLMSEQKGRKAEIVLSDGEDNGSRATMAQAIESAQRADTLVYSILFTDADEYPRPSRGGPDGKRVMQELSAETGGSFFAASERESISSIYDRIQEELRSQYSLGYTSDQPAGRGYRKISLTVKPEGLRVRARDGYYSDGR